VNRFAGVCALAVIISVATPGQKADIPKWVGTWELHVQKSSFGEILFPGAPVDFALLSQRAKLEQATNCVPIVVSRKLTFSRQMTIEPSVG
jgi:hypothetical protein